MSVREVHVSAITDTIKKLCMEANWNLGGEMLRAFDRALTTERSPAGKQVLQILKQNAEMAATKKIAYCQDTGFTVHVLTYPCHITSLPLAVTIECHAHRHKEATL